MINALGARLSSAAKFVRQGAYFADIGTDHAYLPIFLLESGIIKRAVCSDINEGPLMRAMENAKETNQFANIDFVRCDGAKELSHFGLTDVAICGMGAELICDIIESAPFLKSEGIRLILQPMSKQPCLRRYLAESGFAVVEEEYTYESGKFYLCIAAEYTAKSYELDDLEAEIGQHKGKELMSSEMKGYIESKIKSYESAIKGKSVASIDCGKEVELVKKLKSVIE